MTQRPTSPGSKSASVGSGLRLALSRREAAAALGCSLNHFERHVQPELRVVYSGRRRLFPVRELEAWLERNAIAPLGDR
jgi:excisionase family DNA binding protein